jgi:hypothetical protein
MAQDAAAELVRALVDHMKGADDDWGSLSMVVVLDGGRFRSTYGYAYGTGETVSAVASHPLGVNDAVLNYLVSHFGPEPPVKLLVQFDRTTGTTRSLSRTATPTGGRCHRRTWTGSVRSCVRVSGASAIRTAVDRSSQPGASDHSGSLSRRPAACAVVAAMTCDLYRGPSDPRYRSRS